MIYCKSKNLFKLDLKQFIILIIFCSFSKTSSQDLYKNVFEEGLSLDEIALVNDYRAQRYRRQANSNYDRFGIEQSAECGINSYPGSRTKRAYEPQGQYDWPWMVVLLSTQGRSQFCGGVLLNHQYVLTAAHCLKASGGGQISKDAFVIRLGEWNLQRSDDTTFLEVNALEIKMHEDYEPVNERNDIALIKLDRSVEYTQFIRPICLPRETPKTNETTIVAGWGKTESDGDVSPVLLYVMVPIVDHQNCRDNIAAAATISTESNLCAGGEIGHDACQFDSGGPLLYQDSGDDENRWVTVGIVSWGTGCGDYAPGIYTNVHYYLSWIGKRISDSSP